MSFRPRVVTGNERALATKSLNESLSQRHAKNSVNSNGFEKLVEHAARKVRARGGRKRTARAGAGANGRQKNSAAWYQPVALVDHRERRELLERRLRGYALGTVAGTRLRWREWRGRAEGQHTQELIQVAAQLLDLGVAATDDSFELGNPFILDAQQFLKLPQGAHSAHSAHGAHGDRATSTGTNVRHLRDLRGGDGRGEDAGAAGDGRGAVRRQLRRRRGCGSAGGGGLVLLVGVRLLRRREAQRVEAHTHRHAGVADGHSVFCTLVHSTCRGARLRRTHTRSVAAEPDEDVVGRYYRANSRDSRSRLSTSGGPTSSTASVTSRLPVLACRPKRRESEEWKRKGRREGKGKSETESDGGTEEGEGGGKTREGEETIRHTLIGDLCCRIYSLYINCRSVEERASCSTVDKIRNESVAFI